MNMTTWTNPLTDAISGLSSRAYSTIAYLVLSFRSSPPLNQEIAALGEACGRHSKTTSPPLWITVDFFTGRRVKSGGEAEEQSCVKAICLALWRCNSCASAKMSKASQAITWIIFSPADWLIVQNNYGNERARLRLCKKPVQPVLNIYFCTKRFNSPGSTMYIQ